MKRIGIVILMICLLTVLPLLAAAETGGSLRSDVQVSTGPGDKFGLLPDILLEAGARVQVRTQYYNGEETWLQIAFTWQGCPVRGYVRSADVKADIRDVPREAPLCTAVVSVAQTKAAAGPLQQGGIVYPAVIRQDSSAVVYEVEDGWAHIEYWDFDQVKKCRAWLPLTELRTEDAFTGRGYYGVAEEDSLRVPEPTRAPSTYYGSTGQGYPVGKMITVVSGSCHVKREASAESQTVNYAYVGQRYEVLECRTGSTGKDW